MYVELTTAIYQDAGLFREYCAAKYQSFFWGKGLDSGTMTQFYDNMDHLAGLAGLSREEVIADLRADADAA